jgi:hypothetical protein
MTRITTMALAAALVTLASSPVLSQSPGGPAKSGDSITGMGTIGDNGGSTKTGPTSDGPSTKYYQPPVATGLDLKGPTKTEGPFAE